MRKSPALVATILVATTLFSCLQLATSIDDADDSFYLDVIEQAMKKHKHLYITVESGDVDGDGDGDDDRVISRGKFEVFLRRVGEYNHLRGCGFKAMYIFGDSLVDTGNAMIEFPGDVWQYPQGMTLGKVTGRFSDGLVIVDHIAKAAGLPYVNPSLNKSLDHSKGVNFAVGGTGVLSKEARKKWNVVFPFSNSSLDVQLHRFDQFLQKTFKTKIARERHLKSSLFFINGGFNDYQFLESRAGLSVLEQKKLIMPEIVQGLGNAVKKFVSYGARKIIVVGVHPVGCAPDNSTNTKTAGTSTIHCNKETSEYLVLHNKLLQKSINQWRRRFSDARIIYGDVYDASMWVLNHCHALGFRYPQTRCCGTPTTYCGASGSPYCKNPKEYVFWDGLHLTDAAYRDVYHRMIPQIASGLQCGRKNA